LYARLVSKVDDYRRVLDALPEGSWIDYLSRNSNLPGPRGNLELAMAAAELAPAPLIRELASSDDEYLALCGAIGLGRLDAEGDTGATEDLHELADDARWRVREGVAMGLQRLGDVDPEKLASTCRAWLEGGTWLVQRAVIAGLCEPRLLKGSLIGEVLDMLDEVTANLAAASAEDRAGDQFKVLRKSLGYCWSVAVAAAPGPGFDRFERWVAFDDHDVRWTVRSNMGKARMRRADPDRWDGLRAWLESE
jgi:hypothetical protein